MTELPEHLTADGWLRGLFSAQEVRKGGVLKRKIRDVERLCGQDRFMAEVQTRGFQMVRNGQHFVVFCNAEPIRRVV